MFRKRIAFILTLLFYFATLSWAGEVRKLGISDMLLGPSGSTWTSSGGATVRYFPYPYAGAGTSATDNAAVVDVRAYGAVGDGVTDDSAAFQQAIDNAVAAGKKGVYIPDGNYLIGTSLDLTYTGSPPAIGDLYWGLTIYGNGFSSRITARTAGKPLFDCTGAGYMYFSNFSVWNSTNDASNPSVAFLLSRNSGNGSAGQHVFNRVYVEGYFNSAALYSVSSELNKYINSVFINNRTGAKTVAIYDQDTLDVSSDYATVCGDACAGGNTITTFASTTIQNDGATSSGLSLRGFEELFLYGGYFHSAATATNGIEVLSDSGHLGVYGVRAEWEGGRGIHIDNNVTLQYAELNNVKADMDFYGADNSTVERLTLSGATSVTSGINLYNLYRSSVSTSLNGNGLTVRNSSLQNHIRSGSTGSDYTAPATTDGNEYDYKATEGGTTRYTKEINNTTKGRLITHLLRPNILKLRVQNPSFAASFTPVINTAGGVIEMTLTDNVTINSPTLTDIDGTQTGEDGWGGIILAFILKQDATGGRVVTWNALYKTNWTPDTTANKVNVIQFIVGDDGNVYQLSASTGL